MYPIDLNLGFHIFYYYEGFYYLISIAVAYAWAAHRIKKYGLDYDQFSKLIVSGIIGAIVGGRLSHFIFWQPSILISDPLEFFRVWDGGTSITGALAGGIIGARLACIGKKSDFWQFFAVLSPAVLLGQAIGRVGCFLNGDAWGIRTNLPWGVRFPKFGTYIPGFKPDHLVPSYAWTWAKIHGFVSNSSMFTPPLHPTQLYESLGDILLLVFILFIIRRIGFKYSGKLIALIHIGGYCLLRFLLEFLRGDRGAVIWNDMTALQITLIVIFIVSFPIAVISYIRLQQGGNSAPD